MAIKDEQPVTTNCTLSSMPSEVLQLSYTNFIGSLTVLRYSYPLVFRVVVIPALVVVLSFEDEERWDKPATSADSSDQSNLLTITRLASDWVETKL
jgi:hypothetical protein